MSPKATLAAIISVAIILIAYMSMYTVMEGQQALLLRLGKIVKNPTTGQAIIKNPGLHFKLPIANSVRKLDVRLQTLNVDSSRILTAEQKYVLVDYFAKWRIADLALYYKRTGGYPVRAQNLLRQKINDALRAAFGKRNIKDVVSGERMNIMALLQEKANKSAKRLGIRVIDVRIRGIDLPQEVRESVFERMRTEREQVATKHRARGLASGEAIRANADAEVAVTIAKTKATAQRIRASGDKEAADIYIQAYNQDPKFYALYRSLEAYRQVLTNKSTVMILRPDNEFFKYFNQAQQKHSGKK